MTRLSSDQEITVAMYIASFFPKPMGGLEIQGLRLAQELTKQGVRVTIFTHGFKGCVKREVHEGVQLVRLYSWMNVCFDYLHFIKNRIKPRKAVRKSKPAEESELSIPYDISNTNIQINGGVIDLIFYGIQFLNFAWYLGGNRKRFKVLHVHGVPWVSFVGAVIGKLYSMPVLIKESTTIGLKKFDDIVLGRLMRKCVLRYGYFVAISKYIYDVLLQYGVASGRIYYIPNGVTISGCAAEEASDELAVLFVGNLTQGAAKGLDVLLQSWKIVNEHYSSAQLLVAGKVTEHEAWFRLLADLGIERNVVFLGSNNNMSDIYKRVTLFVSPSRREGLSNALLEAMAYGLPCIVTNISGSQDMIENGKSGYVVEPDNVNELADAINSMLTSKSNRKDMGKRAYEKVKSTCSFEKVTKDYHNAYSSLLKAATP